MVEYALKGVFSMVRKKGELFECEECGKQYSEKELAEKCENWCKETNSCNLEIIKHAVN